MCSSGRTETWVLLIASVFGGCGAPPVDPIALACGEKHACALLEDGSIRCWGVWTGTSETPPSLSGPFSAIAAGFAMCGLSGVDGTISCWGHDGALPAPDGVFVEMSGGRQGVCGLTSDGQARCREVIRATQPDDPPPSPEALRLVRVGWSGPCGLRLHDGFPLCWYGSPAVLPPEEPLLGLSVGIGHACGIRSDHSLVCWGVPGGTPEVLEAPPGQFVDVKTNLASSCALDGGGSLTCWGVWYEVSSDFAGPPGAFADYCVGDAFGCGLRADQTIECWGYNEVGQASPPDDL
jgi:hypothetical protein